MSNEPQNEQSELESLTQRLCAEFGEEELTWTAEQAFLYDRNSIEVCEVLGPPHYRFITASYFALVSPPTVKRLLQRLRDLEAEIKAPPSGWRENYMQAEEELAGERTRADKLQQKLDRLYGRLARNMIHTSEQLRTLLEAEEAPSDG